MNFNDLWDFVNTNNLSLVFTLLTVNKTSSPIILKKPTLETNSVRNTRVINWGRIDTDILLFFSNSFVFTLDEYYVHEILFDGKCVTISIETLLLKFNKI